MDVALSSDDAAGYLGDALFSSSGPSFGEGRPSVAPPPAGEPKPKKQRTAPVAKAVGTTIEEPITPILFSSSVLIKGVYVHCIMLVFNAACSGLSMVKPRTALDMTKTFFG